MNRPPLHRVALCAAPLLLAPALTAQTQTLGVWELSPPDSAALIAGGGAAFSWLNVVNAPLTLNEALTGLDFDADGFANADTGTVVEVVFNTPVTNGLGDDLVMLEAQFDTGIYAISSDYDGFVQEVTNDHNGATIVSSQAYYYQSAGPYGADVTAVPVDLDDIGVPPGASVSAVRFRTTNDFCDPIGLGRIGGAGPTLIVTGGCGQPGSGVGASGMTPGGLVGFAASSSNAGATLNVGSCGPVTVDLGLPIVVIGLVVADGAGNASVMPPNGIPAVACGWYLQALDLNSCTTTASAQL